MTSARTSKPRPTGTSQVYLALRHDEAIAILHAKCLPIAALEDVLTAETTGRFLAADVAALRSSPSHDNAAVDGFAFSHRAYVGQGPDGLPLRGRAAAGHPLSEVPDADSAVSIMTGAVLSSPLDTVAPYEDADFTNFNSVPSVRLPRGLTLGANVRKAGEDFKAGDVIARSGHVLRPQDVAAFAALGVSSLACFKPLRVGIASTGDELIRQPGAVFPGAIYDSNGPQLAALVRLTGAGAIDLGLWSDNSDEVALRLQDACQRCDVILTTGGASRSETDHIAPVIESLGELSFRHIAVKPGRAVVFGSINATPVFGLPGNPVAAFITYLIYVHAALRSLGGASWREPRRYTIPSDFNWQRDRMGRREFLRGFFAGDGAETRIGKFPRDGSGLISSLLAADGLIEISEQKTEIAKGDPLAFIPFTEFGISPR